MSHNIKEIARMAGVSPATVSRVLNNSKPVNADVRERVQAVIEQTDFIPNALARGLVSKQTRLIGVIIPEINEYFAMLMEGIERAGKQEGYNIMLFLSHSDPNLEFQALTYFKENQLDGVIFSGVEVTERHYEKMAKVARPVLLIGQPLEREDIPTLSGEKASSYSAVRAMITHFIRTGHRRIGMIRGPLRDKAAGEMRYQAYRDTLTEFGLKPQPGDIQESEFHLDGGYQAMGRILANDKWPTAVFAASDLIAIGAINYALDRGCRVPEDISIAGFDDIQLASMFRPRLTTVRIDCRDRGEKVMRTLLGKIRTGIWQPLEPEAPFEIVVRESTRSIATV